jgi:hypothetical protein
MARVQRLMQENASWLAQWLLLPAVMRPVDPCETLSETWRLLYWTVVNLPSEKKN